MSPSQFNSKKVEFFFIFKNKIKRSKQLLQIMGLDTSYLEISDMYHYDQEPKVLSVNSIKDIPTFYFSCSGDHQTTSSCSICLQVVICNQNHLQMRTYVIKCNHIAIIIYVLILIDWCIGLGRRTSGKKAREMWPHVSYEMHR